MNRIRKLSWKDVLCIAVVIACGLFFFRSVLFNDVLLGDAGDGRFTSLVAEHWYQVFCGRERLTELVIYYPTRRVLAFSDYMLGLGLIHSMFRALGLDLYQAYKLTVIAVHFFGSFSMYYLLKRVLNIKAEWALIGTLVFSYSTIYAVFIIHTQLVTISAIPLFLTFLIRAIQNTANRKKRNLYICAAIVSIEAVLYTAWYIAFFSALYVVIFCLIWLIVSAVMGRSCIRKALAGAKCIGKDWLVFLLLAAGLTVPFVLLELPLLKESGGYEFESVLSDLPTMQQAFRIDSRDWFAWNLYKLLGNTAPSEQAGELASGIPVIAFLLFMALSVILFARFLIRSIRRRQMAAYSGKKSEREARIEDEQDNSCCIKQRISRRVLIGSLFLSIIICALLTVRFEGVEDSLWRLIFNAFPGAKSIRAVSRFLFFLLLPLGCAIAVFGNEVSFALDSDESRKCIWYKWSRRIGMLILIVVIIISTFWIGGVDGKWNSQNQEEMLAAIDPPPEDCKVFAIFDPSDQIHDIIDCEMRAFEIADYFDLKTINGYSGALPEEMLGISDIKGEQYLESVKHWAERFHLENVYLLDLYTGTWTKFEYQ